MRRKIPKHVKDYILTRDDYRCYYCYINLNKLNSYDITVDHIRHVYRGGNNNVQNLVACCRRCNASRGALTQKEFLNVRQDERHERIEDNVLACLRCIVYLLHKKG